MFSWDIWLKQMGRLYNNLTPSQKDQIHAMCDVMEKIKDEKQQAKWAEIILKKAKEFCEVNRREGQKLERVR